ncbi:head-tail adaptor [Loktanella fryxellensis]|uniref:Head-tail adaptor n=1 Tax=Loktanella fryxellensis TaxID=245187 RepID=A0A1H7YCX3_9RHOB|nr:head-tail adaptor protein [Loktanella fryxellensis]SEM43980.1 head-tail adaptor [Loktanella fryxellensis]
MNGLHLNRRLVLEAPVAVPDGSGGQAVTWTALGTLWAQVAPGAGVERAANGLTLSRVPLVVTVRAAPPGAPSRPVAGQRFRAGARTYAILAVTERDTEGRYLTCHAAEEVVA